MIRVASYNIRKCIGTDRRRVPGRVLDVIAEVDAVVQQRCFFAFFFGQHCRLKIELRRSS